MRSWTRLFLALLLMPAIPVLAAEPRWWSLQPLYKPKPPTVQPVGFESWPRTSIDRFIVAKHVEKGLHPSPEADRRTLLRRLTFDLLGLPPTPDEIAAFLAD